MPCVLIGRSPSCRARLVLEVDDPRRCRYRAREIPGGRNHPSHAHVHVGGQGNAARPDHILGAVLLARSATDRLSREHHTLRPEHSRPHWLAGLFLFLRRPGTRAGAGAASASWRLIDHPESRLAFAATTAEAEGFRPIHLAINPLQDVYLSPVMPNVVFPFWEFPDVPDSRLRLRHPPELGSHVPAGLARAHGLRVHRPRLPPRPGWRSAVAVVPIPVDPEAFALPDWDPAHSWTFSCRHEVLGPGSSPIPAATSRPPSERAQAAAAVAPRARAWHAARGGFRRVRPWIGRRRSASSPVKRRVAKASGCRRFSLPGARRLPAARPPLAQSRRRSTRITSAKVAALALVGREPTSSPTRRCPRPRSPSAATA